MGIDKYRLNNNYVYGQLKAICYSLFVNTKDTTQLK